jgi:archaeosine synthase beta-subunit
MPDAAVYPASTAGRDRFVLDRRGSRVQHDPWRYQGLFVEDERRDDGSISRMATVLITGRECPWRCVMCDLWRYTTVSDTPPGAIAAQVAAAREVIDREHQSVAGLKLYNAGSFFDARAVPDADYDDIAASLAGLSQVIVESHPSLVIRSSRLERFLTALARHAHPERGPVQLEVAIGLETAHPIALDRLNKRFTLERFAEAARRLRDRDVALRVFLLISPPFIPLHEQDEWLRHSIDAAFDCHASVVSLVPTRAGNGAIDALAETGDFHAPTMDDVERSFAIALQHARRRGRVFVDLWDLSGFSHCPHCFEARRDRLHAMNLEQRILPPLSCPAPDHRSLQ